ncbi:MAG: Gmad2 immunoglobulin-like domain-containing protein [Patescibacteria group bacterium]
MKRSLVFSVAIALIVAISAFLLLKKPAIAPEETPTPTGLIFSSPLSGKVTATPVPSGTAIIQNIIVTSPSVNAIVGNPITVIGKARVFEGVFQYALRDMTGKVWYRANGQTGAPEDSNYQPFTVKIPVPVGTPKDLIIEVFEYSAKDGSIINLVRVPVRFSTLTTATVKVYLSSHRLNSGDVCSVVFPVERTIIKTQETAYISLTELLKGPTDSDKVEQYYTSIPEGVKVNSVRITNGIAYADFDGTLEYQVGGSCRVGVIRLQITNTLKQFSSIKDVVISINGRIDDILQP